MLLVAFTGRLYSGNSSFVNNVLVLLSKLKPSSTVSVLLQFVVGNTL